MLLPPAREKTNLPRVFVAIVFAFAFPPIAPALIEVVLKLPKGAEEIPVILAALLGALVMSLLAGWIFVLPACVAWAVLHQFDRHYRSAAALVGFTTGLAFGALLASFGDDGSPLVGRPLVEMLLAGAVIGALTGLGVWWIAYGRQGGLSQMIITRPPLNL